jgi:hypothetical protein
VPRKSTSNATCELLFSKNHLEAENVRIFIHRFKKMNVLIPPVLRGPCHNTSNKQNQNFYVLREPSDLQFRMEEKISTSAMLPSLAPLFQDGFV